MLFACLVVLLLFCGAGVRVGTASEEGRADAFAAQPADQTPSAPARNTETSRVVDAASASPVLTPSVGGLETSPRTRSAPAPTGPVVSAAPKGVRRDTPRDTIAGFMAAGREQDFSRAASYLNLVGQKKSGPALAKQLFEIIERQVWFDMDSISDDPNAGIEKPLGVREVQVASLPIKGGSQGIRLTRLPDSSGIPGWVFSQSTVDAIGELHKRYGPPCFLDSIPGWMRGSRLFGLEPWQWAGLVLLLAACWILGVVLERTAGVIARAVTRRRGAKIDDELARLFRGPTAQFAGLILFKLMLPQLNLVASAQQLTSRLVHVGIIIAVMRASITVLNYGAALFERHGKENPDGELKRREVATRVTTLRRIAVVLVWVVSVALALMQFPFVRTVGISLLGSAGIAGAILGFAAQKTFSNVFSGFVISLTQPIRIGDTVVVEKEFGKIEEIGTTHVMVKLWDLRRLVLPISYFLDHPFENWTRTGAELIGAVRLRADYRVGVNEVRTELDQILRDEPLWNGKTANVVVEDLTEEVVVLRVLVSADDSDKVWDLRCKVRERLLAFLQKAGGRIPVRRIETAARREG